MAGFFCASNYVHSDKYMLKTRRIIVKHHEKKNDNCHEAFVSIKKYKHNQKKKTKQHIIYYVNL